MSKKIKDDEDSLAEELVEEEEEQRSSASSIAIASSSEIKKSMQSVTIVLSKEEYNLFIELLMMCTSLLNDLAMQAVKQNDEKSFDVLSARYKLLKQFNLKLLSFSKIPDPPSREVH